MKERGERQFPELDAYSHLRASAITGNTFNRCASKTADGFTLTELLIAMALGLILITGIISVFVGSKRSSTLNTAVADMQESARYALDAITRDARMAGFQGCLDVNSQSANLIGNNLPTSPPGLVNTLATGSVVVSANAWVPAPIPTFTIPTGAGSAVPGTHTLALQFGRGTATLSAPMTNPANPGNPSAAPIPIRQNFSDIRPGDLAIIGDCVEVDLFRVSSAPQPRANGLITHLAFDNASGNLTKHYGQGPSLTETRIMKFHSNVYFVGTRGETNERGDQLRSLYVQTLPYDATNPPTELIQGVENFRIRFGIRRNNGALEYHTANQPGYNSANVEVIQIGLMMASYEYVRNDKDSTTYILAGQEISAIDDKPLDGLNHSENQQYRLVFNTTIKIRNRRDQEQ